MWQSLYLYCAEAVSADAANDALINILRSSLEERGYALYDPFTGITATAYSQQMRLFVAPPAGRWLRILGNPNADLMMACSALGPALFCTLPDADTEAHILCALHGEETDPAQGLKACLLPGKSEEDLKSALTRRFEARAQSENELISALPDDVQRMAKDLNPKHINKLFNKWMKQVSKRFTADEDEARRLISAGVDWGSPGAQRLTALMACLTIPADYWRLPDFVDLRDAYQLHLRRQRKADARLLPGDAETMAAVPDALRYTPVYAGKVA